MTHTSRTPQAGEFWIHGHAESWENFAKPTPLESLTAWLLHGAGATHYDSTADCATTIAERCNRTHWAEQYRWRQITTEAELEEIHLTTDDDPAHLLRVGDYLADCIDAREYQGHVSVTYNLTGANHGSP